MRYKLPIDRSVNRLVPHYLSGRRFILFVQSCLYPLQSLNERFRTFARERHIEARMTSQVIYFEWFLNYRFGKYIKDGKDRIFIKMIVKRDMPLSSLPVIGKRFRKDK